MAVIRLSLLLVVILCRFEYLHSTLSRSDKDKPKKQNQKTKSKTTTVGNIEYALTSSEILLNHQRVDYREEKKFPSAVLGYVTPWNNHGYDVAKYLAHKFTHISPVWFQLRRINDKFVFGGTHDLDQGWIADIRKNNSNIKVVPRVLFENWDPIDYRSLFMDEELQDECAGIILNFIKRNKFDGMVLELWTQVAAMTRGQGLDDVVHFIIHIAEIIRENGIQVILVIPPPLGPKNEPSVLFKPSHFQLLVPYLDYISVMTYDFPDKGVGPVGPISWAGSCIESLISQVPSAAPKILLGLNFYGYDYKPRKGGMDAIVGSTYLDILRKHNVQIHWNRQAAEHYVEYDGRTVFYPSLMSIEARLNLAKRLGVGVAIWETGQGLDYFYNLL